MTDQKITTNNKGELEMTNDIKVRLHMYGQHDGHSTDTHVKMCFVSHEVADYIKRLEAQLEDAANSGAWETGYNRGHTDALEEAAKTEEER